MAPRTHAYTSDLADLALERWRELEAAPNPGPCQPRRGGLPQLEALRHLFSVAFQASMLREEDRPVRFRLLVGEPHALEPQLGPPEGLHRLRFEKPRPFDEHEIRRLSQAAKYHRSMIGVRAVEDGQFEIWGIVQSGPRWMQSARGGRDLPSPIPQDAVVVRVEGAGHVAVAVGDVTLAELLGGHLSGGTVNVFEAHWLKSRFVDSRLQLLREHELAVGKTAIPLEFEALRSVSQQMVKRLISTIQDSRHGGTVVFVPRERTKSVLHETETIQLKYAFESEEPRRRYRTLILALMKELTAAASEIQPRPQHVDFALYMRSARPALAAIDEAIFEMSQLIAALADVDGAVVLNERFEVLGFGGEIVGTAPEVTTIRHGLDLEAETFEVVPIDGVGTRHRAAYRLCAQEHEAFAIVVSQDGGVQFVAWHAGALTYWDHRKNP